MARTLSLGLAVAIGAALIGAASPAVATGDVRAADAASCPAADLTKSQLNSLLDDLTAATVAKAADGLRYVLAIDDDDLGPVKLIATSDGTSHRLDVSLTFGSDNYRDRYLANGYHYQLLSTRHPEDKAGLAVLHRANAWVNIGKTSADDALADVVAFSGSIGGGTCEATDTGLTITVDESGDTTTITTDTSLAVLTASSEAGGKEHATATATYGSYVVADIATTDRITMSAWSHALDSADQRAELTTWGKRIATAAKATAKKAKRSVTAADVQKAGKASPLKGTKLISTAAGISVTAKTKDRYTGKVLVIRITVANKTVTVAGNW